MKKTLLLLVLLVCNYGSAWAAEAPAGDSVESENIEAQTEDAEAVELIADSEQEAGQTEEEENEDSQSRFIPTEQISQDLGVSFPVDI